jgi:hypothetical protein
VTLGWLCPSASAPAGGEGFGFGAKHVVVAAGVTLASLGRRQVQGAAFQGRQAVGWAPRPAAQRMGLPTRNPEAPKLVTFHPAAPNTIGDEKGVFRKLCG